MNNKELSQLYYLKREIASLKRRIKGMPKGEEQLKQEISDKLNRCITLQKEVEDYISSVEDSFTRQLLTYRYIERLPWRAIAFKVGGNNTSDSVRMHVNRYLRKH